MLESQIVCNKDFIVGKIDERLYGSFLEHMGRVIYHGVYEPGHVCADEEGFRTDVLQAVRELNKKEKITVIWVTHYMDEVVEADSVIVMNKGEIALEGTPKQIFPQVELLQQYRLDVPQATLLAHELRKRGLPIPEDIITVEELVDAVAYALGK